MTTEFQERAIKAGFEERSVPTHAITREAKDYLNGAALTPEQVQDLVKELKREDKFGWARRVIAKFRSTDIPSATLRS